MSRAERAARILPVAVPIAIYCALAVLAFLPVAPFSSSHLPQCNCADYAKMAAFLEWTPWAILHGHNPFFTNYQDWPGGVNLADNTSMPFVGLMMAPITLTGGPILAMNIVARLALAGAATTAFLVFRRLVNWTPAAFVGGLLFGFSPYMMAHINGHPNLIFMPFLPLLLLLGHEIVVRQQMRPRTAGLLLGLVAAAQFGVSTEILADAALMSVVAIVFLAAAHHRTVRARVPYALRGVGWGLVVFVPIVAYPVWMDIDGPGHLTGPAQPLFAINPLRSDLLGAVFPTRNELFSLGHLGVTGSSFVAHNLVENATYIGVPLLLLLACAVVAYRRDAVLVLACALVLFCYIASLGIYLNVNGRSTGFEMPFRILLHLPLLNSAIAERFFAIGYLFLALGLAAALSNLRASLSRRNTPRFAADFGCLLLGVAVLVPLIPRLPIGTRPPKPSVILGSYAVPPYFSGGGEDSIPDGSVILVYPYSTDGFLNYSILWQAIGGERFRLTDGDATIKAPDGVGDSASPQLEPPELENLLDEAYFGRVVTPTVDNLGLRAVAEMRHALRHYGFSTVVVDPVGTDPSAVVEGMALLLGRSPERSGGVYVWYGVQQDLRRFSRSRLS
jgi:hypothetical protein